MAETVDEPGRESVRPDDLNDIGVLRRREIEARIVAPLLERLGAEFGTDQVQEVAAEVVINLARDQGRALADQVGGNDLTALADSMAAWRAGDAMDIDVVEQTPDRYAFNVTRCGYADMYRALGLGKLGTTLSCNRDATLVEGFNPNIEFTRTKTIMSGSDHCDFVYTLKPVDP